MKLSILKILVLTLSVFSTSLLASPKLLALGGIEDGMNLPPLSYMLNSRTLINDKGYVCVKLISIDSVDRQSIFCLNTLNNKSQIIAAEHEGTYLSTPHLTNNNVLIYEEYDEIKGHGVFEYHLDSGKRNLVFKPNQLHERQIGPKKIGNSYVWRSDKDRTRLFVLTDGAVNELKLKEEVSFVFDHQVNKKGDISFKVRYGKTHERGERRPDALVLFDGTKFKTLVSDFDKDENSKFEKLSNFIRMNEKGDVAFLAGLENNRWKLFISTKEGLEQVNFSQSMMTSILQFAPTINNQKNICVRVEGYNSGPSIMCRYGEQSVLVAHREMEVDTPNGRGILWHPNGPAFDGGISLNNKDQLVFKASIYSKDKKKFLGKGVFLVNLKDYLVIE